MPIDMNRLILTLDVMCTYSSHINDLWNGNKHVIVNYVFFLSSIMELFIVFI